MANNQTAVVLLNGIRFPFPVVEAAIQWAKENQANLHAYFIKSADIADEGYVFPSDLDEAEDLKDEQDSESNHVRVIYRNARLIKSMSSTDKVDCETTILTEPHLKEIEESLQKSAVIFIDEEFDQKGALTSNIFDREKLEEKFPDRIKAVQHSKP